jgi:plastocyanin
MLASLLLAALLAPAGQARTASLPRASAAKAKEETSIVVSKRYTVIRISCSQVILEFRDFPVSPDPSHAIRESLTIDGNKYRLGTFTFEGTGALQTISIAAKAPPGKYTMDVEAYWNTDGLKAGFDVPTRMKCGPKPAFSIEKRQEIAGSAEGYTTSELTAKVGQTVNYEIIVTNTGNVPLTFSNFTDAKCQNITGGRGTPVSPGESITYFCEHVLTGTGSYTNTASDTGTPPAGDGSPVTKESNTVTVRLAEEPSFTIEKLQKIDGGPFTTSKLTGAEVGQKVEYEIIVTNTGNVPLEFKKLIDANCEDISPSGEETLAAGEEETYTCQHVLSEVGTYSNQASIETTNEGNIKHESNEVEVEVPKRPEFTIEKLQKVDGGPYITSKLIEAEVGQTVEYEIIVTNTGNVPLEFKKLIDANCEDISPSGEETLAAGEEETYTCQHVLSEVGTYSNQASIETTNEGSIKHESNIVEAEVPKRPEFTIEKLQKIDGGPYTTSLLTDGEIGRTVDYKIIVRNTGNVPLEFKKLIDANCEDISPSGEETLAAGEEQTYTCEHELRASGVYTNEASIEGNEGTGTKTSNKVEAEVGSGGD